jgi:carbonic anhydrase/acetyltransferase-like protein (isoleucine patch superfamily)
LRLNVGETTPVPSMHGPSSHLPLIQAFDGFVPQIGEGVFIAPNATLVGNVNLKEQSTIWYGAVLRGDIGSITVGERSTIQDLCCLHTKKGGPNVVIEEDVHVGHGSIIHGATISAGAYLGNAVIVMDGAKIGQQAVISAGTLISRGVEIPPRVFVRGRPARIVRELTEDEHSMGRSSCANQMELGRVARGAFASGVRT